MLVVSGLYNGVSGSSEHNYDILGAFYKWAGSLFLKYIFPEEKC